MQSGGAVCSAALHFWHALEGKSMVAAVRIFQSKSLVGFIEIAPVLARHRSLRTGPGAHTIRRTARP